jgi:hypothetical protein
VKDKKKKGEAKFNEGYLAGYADALKHADEQKDAEPEGDARVLVHQHTSIGGLKHPETDKHYSVRVRVDMFEVEDYRDLDVKAIPYDRETQEPLAHHLIVDAGIQALIGTHDSMTGEKP